MGGKTHEIRRLCTCSNQKTKAKKVIQDEKLCRKRVKRQTGNSKKLACPTLFGGVMCEKAGDLSVARVTLLGKKMDAVLS